MLPLHPLVRSFVVDYIAPALSWRHWVTNSFPTASGPLSFPLCPFLFRLASSRRLSTTHRYLPTLVRVFFLSSFLPSFLPSFLLSFFSLSLYLYLSFFFSRHFLFWSFYRAGSPYSWASAPLPDNLRVKLLHPDGDCLRPGARRDAQRDLSFSPFSLWRAAARSDVTSHPLDSPLPAERMLMILPPVTSSPSGFLSRAFCLPLYPPLTAAAPRRYLPAFHDILRFGSFFFFLRPVR